MYDYDFKGMISFPLFSGNRRWIPQRTGLVLRLLLEGHFAFADPQRLTADNGIFFA